jgi:hypothetical protein
MGSERNTKLKLQEKTTVFDWPLFLILFILAIFTGALTRVILSRTGTMRGSLKRIIIAIGVAAILFWGGGMMIATSVPIIIAGEPLTTARLFVALIEGILIAVGVLIGFVAIGAKLAN